MNACLPQANYLCGSLGHAFMVCICTRNQNQTSFYPSVPHEISVSQRLSPGSPTKETRVRVSAKALGVQVIDSFWISYGLTH
ncbi:hypothetical protein RHMOL_Rhmol02G0117400 [Rhododendron molle]|uniref:Uncharacterized protein n=1 Tax=Rhododendron molle TaxID=49168 RepID=A0ACC0PQH7_RHOML|nr:hypothetical protein RHMOL_Rhmol02G0117400 [Rhododendron molle]